VLFNNALLRVVVEAKPGRAEHAASEKILLMTVDVRD
jgi:hypothetical protein